MSRALKLIEHFRSSDLALSSFLSLSFPLEAIDRTNPQKAIFIFKRDEELDKLLEIYWRGEAQVNPQAYFTSLKVIKSRLYENY